MRGDSLRDFYAKSLAILGLGLLAGAGAMVDYWPVGAPLPSVDAAVLPAPAGPALAQRLDQQIPRPNFGRPLPAPVVISARNVGSARFYTPKVAQPAVAAVEPAETPVISAVAIPDVTIAVSTSALDDIVEPQEIAWQIGEPPRAQLPPTPGLIGEALRKTKDSIVRTGAATRSTIADAFRGVVGAFKKVSPF